MNRSTRTLLVLGVATLLASAATWLVYWTIQNRPPQIVEVAHAYAVVASRPLELGARITEADVKLVPWPSANPVPGGFTNVTDVLERGVVTPISQNEPLTANNVAPKEAGVGLPPTIPPGMRAVSVRVNDVIGVAGFVLPWTRVDVMVVLRDGASSLARVVVSNVQVLAAGTRYDQELAREGKALPSSVVTLLATPEDAEKITLAAAEGQIQLTLRNPLDTAPTASPGTRMSSLSSNAPAPSENPAPRPRRAAQASPPAPPPPPPPPPPPSTVTVIRAGKPSPVEIKKGSGGGGGEPDR
jgi:pilus assembly protein CpaB